MGIVMAEPFFPKFRTIIADILLSWITVHRIFVKYYYDKIKNGGEMAEHLSFTLPIKDREQAALDLLGKVEDYFKKNPGVESIQIDFKEIKEQDHANNS
jgi:hypothetical protein